MMILKFQKFYISAIYYLQVQQLVKMEVSTNLYQDKIHNYHSNTRMYIGRLIEFQDYYREFAQRQSGHGLDLGAGPKGVSHVFFQHCARFDGCDAEQCVLDSLPNAYKKTFLYSLGTKEPLPYDEGSLDFAICSRVIQHLGSWQELVNAMVASRRVLKKGGEFFLVYKVGNNDTVLTHYNTHYCYQRSFRVFQSQKVEQMMKEVGFILLKEDRGVDGVYLPYSFMTFQAA